MAQATNQPITQNGPQSRAVSPSRRSLLGVLGGAAAAFAGPAAATACELPIEPEDPFPQLRPVYEKVVRLSREIDQRKERFRSWFEGRQEEVGVTQALEESRAWNPVADEIELLKLERDNEIEIMIGLKT